MLCLYGPGLRGYKAAPVGKVYDTSFREMFARGLPALLPWLLPQQGNVRCSKRPPASDDLALA